MNWSSLPKFGRSLRRYSAAPRRPVRGRPLGLDPLEDRLAPAAPLQFFYVPLPEQPTLGSLEAIGSGSQGNDMTSF